MSSSMHISSLSRFRIKLIEWLFYLIAFTLPIIQPHWNAKIVILLSVISLYKANLQQIWLRIKFNKIYLLFASLFFLDLIGMIHTQNTNYGFRYLETKAPILVFPFLILINWEVLDETIIHNICRSLLAGVLTVLAGYAVIITGELITNGFLYNDLINTRLTYIPAIANQTLLDIHPTFLSLYISFCFLFILISLGNNPSRRKVWINGTALVIIFVFQLWLNSRAGIGGFGFVLVVFYFLNASKRKKVLSLAIACVLILMLIVSPITRERFILGPVRALNHIGEVDLHDEVTWPISFRLQILDCSIHLLRDNHWILGYGTGDFRDKIRECSREKQYGWLTARDLDAHNEYFAQIHRHGVIGLVLFLACLTIPLMSAFKQEQTLYFIFIILVSTVALSETILSSQKGVVFYALFNSLLCLKAKKTNPIHSII